MKNRYWLIIGLVILGVVLALLVVSRSNYEALQADLANLQADYDSVKSELDDIKKVYPARDFSSLEELKDWLLENDVSELPPAATVEQLYSKGLTIQEDALEDGYIISVDFEVPIYIACVAIINGYLWVWEPESDDPFLYSGWGQVR